MWPLAECAGWFARRNCRQKATSDLLLDPAISSVLLLGDNQYYCGGYQAWLQSYDKSWGRVRGITRPARRSSSSACRSRQRAFA
jgi:hypothetical protein